jgi:predicted ABC-type ATPase
VRQGRHDIPEPDVRRRFVSGLRNLFRLYRPLCDCWRLYDAFRLPPAPIACKRASTLTILDADLFSQIQHSIKE